ncbi:MAG: PilZ domain-containing protein [bacterium]|nr:PilZ domain-containing protein [bacterium]
MQQQDRRKDRRLPIKLYLEINHMFRQGEEVINDMDAKIEVINISKSGIGFISKATLPIDYYFNARIALSEKEYFFAVIKINRKKQCTEERYLYGAEFVGLAPFLADKIDVYEYHLYKEIMK